MTIKVRPITGDEPGLCDAYRDGKPCVEEAVVHATVPIPGRGNVTVETRWCRRDWADVLEAEQLDLQRKLGGLEVREQNGSMTLGAYPPMRDSD